MTARTTGAGPAHTVTSLNTNFHTPAYAKRHKHIILYNLCTNAYIHREAHTEKPPQTRKHTLNTHTQKTWSWHKQCLLNIHTAILEGPTHTHTKTIAKVQRDSTCWNYKNLFQQHKSICQNQKLDMCQDYIFSFCPFPDEEAPSEPREKTDECIHGLANRSPAKNHCWESRFTQCRNIKGEWCLKMNIDITKSPGTLASSYFLI